MICQKESAWYDYLQIWHQRLVLIINILTSRIENKNMILCLFNTNRKPKNKVSGDINRKHIKIQDIFCFRQRGKGSFFKHWTSEILKMSCEKLAFLKIKKGKGSSIQKQSIFGSTSMILMNLMSWFKRILSARHILHTIELNNTEWEHFEIVPITLFKNVTETTRHYTLKDHN